MKVTTVIMKSTLRHEWVKEEGCGWRWRKWLSTEVMGGQGLVVKDGGVTGD